MNILAIILSFKKLKIFAVYQIITYAYFLCILEEFIHFNYFIIIIFSVVCVYMFVSICEGMPCVVVPEKDRKELNHQEARLTGSVSHLTWVLETEL